MAMMLPVGLAALMSPASQVQKPAIGFLLQVGTYRRSVGKPPMFAMMPRIGRAASPAYLQPSSLASHAPLLFPAAKTRFLSKQTVAAS
jgi:hypothetical protein